MFIPWNKTSPRKVRDTANKKYVDDNVGTTNTFNTDDFSVVVNAVSLKNKTSYWSCAGVNFGANDPDVIDLRKSISTGKITINQDNVSLMCPVFLPHGAIVTACVVEGAAAQTWTLYRATITGAAAGALASAAVDTEDTSISNATVDNSTYYYWIGVASVDTADEIYGARITYTTDYI